MDRPMRYDADMAVKANEKAAQQVAVRRAQLTILSPKAEKNEPINEEERKDG